MNNQNDAFDVMLPPLKLAFVAVELYPLISSIIIVLLSDFPTYQPSHGYCKWFQVSKQSENIVGDASWSVSTLHTTQSFGA